MSPETIHKNLTDEQVTRVLAEREGLDVSRVGKDIFYCYACAKEVDANHGFDHHVGILKTRLPSYLTSRDALAPVLEGLSEEEWGNLLETLFQQARDFRTRGPKDCMNYTLTMPARVLAYAIAEAIQQQPKAATIRR